MLKLFRISTLAALALGVTALSANGQGSKQFGVVAGVDFSTVTGDDLIGDNSTKTGFMGGLFVAIPFGSSGSMAIEPEVLYSMKGAKYEGTGFESTASADYIEIPVLFRYNFKPAGGPYFLAGPAVNFNVNCEVATTLSGQAETKTDCGDEALTTFGGVLALGFSKGRIGIEGRYDFDFTDAAETSTGSSVDAKNSVWAILLRFTK